MNKINRAVIGPGMYHATGMPDVPLGIDPRSAVTGMYECNGDRRALPELG